MKTTEQKLYGKAIETWGVDAQVNMCEEECAELIVAILHYKRGRIGAAKVAEEVADVEIMCGQMREILGDGVVDLAKVEKLSRLSNLLYLPDEDHGTHSR